MPVVLLIMLVFIFERLTQVQMTLYAYKIRGSVYVEGSKVTEKMMERQTSHFPPTFCIQVWVSKGVPSLNASVLQILFLFFENSGLICDKNHI